MPQLQEKFIQEHAQVVTALGAVATGGIIKNIQHVDVSSWPDAADDACIDLALAVWPFPLEPGPRATFETFIRHAERMSLTSAEGIRYLAPELVLLYKSRNTSGQVYPALEPERRAWLHWALVATELRHGWLASLI